MEGTRFPFGKSMLGVPTLLLVLQASGNVLQEGLLYNLTRT